MIYTCLFDEWNRIKKFWSFLGIWTEIAYPDLRRNLENLLILKFLFICSKTVKVSQYDQI